jgi:ABC-type branched-subunit amino acid transport system substrate-binding protein
MRARLVPVALVVLVLAAACSNSKSGSTQQVGPGAGKTCTSPNETQGVTGSEIRVGGVASVHNSLGFDYGEAFKGTQAYFQMINEQGGVFGRKLKLVAAEDDGMVNNQQTVQRILTNDNVFAMAPVASLLFFGAKTLAQQCVPTFGWNINPEWASGPNLFGDKGSNLNFSAPSLGAAYIASQLGAKKAAVLAYNIPQSSQCATGMTNTWKKFPNIATLAYSDTKMSYPLKDVSGDVAAMKAKGVDFVMACFDAPNMATLAAEMHKQGMKATMFLSDGYYNSIRDNPNFEGAVAQTFFAPLTLQNKPKGLQDYLEWMQKTNTPVDEISLVGWTAADMLVTGIEKAGKNFTRSSVVKALNEMTDYNADGLLPGIDWTIAHSAEWNPPCAAYSVVRDKQFVPTYGQKDKPFLCFDPNTPANTVPKPIYK